MRARDAEAHAIAAGVVSVPLVVRDRGADGDGYLGAQFPVRAEEAQRRRVCAAGLGRKRAGLGGDALALGALNGGIGDDLATLGGLRGGKRGENCKADERAGEDSPCHR